MRGANFIFRRQFFYLSYWLFEFSSSFGYACNPTDTDLIVYRGIQDNVFNEVLKSLIEEASIFPDCDLYDKGILATSLVKGKELRGSRSPQKPNKFKGFRILVPKGSHVKYMGNVNFEEHYYEVDIQYGAKLQVISADKEYINCLLLSTN